MKKSTAITRRHFLKTAAAIGALSLTSKARAQPAKQTSATKYENIFSRRRLFVTFGKTLFETFVLRFGSQKLDRLFNKISGFEKAAHSQNAKEWGVQENQKKSEKNRKAEFLKVVVFAPILEELLFRFLPSKMIDEAYPNGVGKDVWGVGIPVAIIFAAIHKSHFEGAPTELQKRYIPASQFCAGLYTWWLMRNRGLPYAVAAHTANNLMAELGVFNVVYNEENPKKGND